MHEFQLALAAHQAGNLQEAKVQYEYVLQKDPKHADTLHLLGVLNCQQNNNEHAIEMIKRAISISPGQALFFANLGVALKSVGRLKEAEEAYNQALRIDAKCVTALSNFANMLQEQQRDEEAKKLINACIGLSLQELTPTVRRSLAQGLISTGNNDAALEVLSSLSKERPSDPEVLHDLGAVLFLLGRYEESREVSARSVELRPDHPGGHYNLAVAFHTLKDTESALKHYNHTIALDPKHVKALSNAGVIYHKRNEFERARVYLERALMHQPDFLDAKINLGCLLKDMDLLAESDIVLTDAIRQSPECVKAHLNRAITLLSAGNFQEGWEEYEWRWRDDQLTPELRELAGLKWNGEQEIRGRTIFLYAEQGFGDTIQFIRYVPWVVGLGAHVILEVPPNMLELYSGIKGLYRLVSRTNEPPKDIDFHCSLMSLPRAFQTRLGTIPTKTPALRITQTRLDHWRQRLSSHQAPLIGIAWSGRQTHNNDHNRSLPLASFLKIFDRECCLVSLQKDVRPEDLEVAESDARLLLLGGEIETFSDTAAILSNVKLVVSVDTSIAHLSASLGLPTWILLPFNPDFRWLRERTDSPWYPSVRLFRQTQPNDWTDILSVLRGEINRGLWGST